MSWIGRKIYEYLKECEEYKQTWSPKSDNLGEPPRSDESKKRKTAELLKEYFEKTPKEKVLEDWNACRSDIVYGAKSFAGLDKRKVGEEMSKAKGCVPKPDNIPPAPEKVYIQKPVDLFNLQASIITPPAPERVPFENFKNNKKSMRKTIEHNERYTLTSIKEDGKVSITIEPKKGFDVCNLRLSVGSVETPKEPVLPKELLNPKPELQAQYDTLAKLIATRDYYNAGHVFNHRDRVYCICSGDVISVNRYECEITPLFFKDGETAQLFQKNFRNQIEQVKHLI